MLKEKIQRWLGIDVHALPARRRLADELAHVQTIHKSLIRSLNTDLDLASKLIDKYADTYNGSQELALQSRLNLFAEVEIVMQLDEGRATIFSIEEFREALVDLQINERD